jgi:hypothetical protein
MWFLFQSATAPICTALLHIAKRHGIQWYTRRAGSGASNAVGVFFVRRIALATALGSSPGRSAWLPSDRPSASSTRTTLPATV